MSRVPDNHLGLLFSARRVQSNLEDLWPFKTPFHEIIHGCYYFEIAGRFVAIFINGLGLIPLDPFELQLMVGGFILSLYPAAHSASNYMVVLVAANDGGTEIIIYDRAP